MIFFAALILAAVLTFIIVRIFTNARSGKALAQFDFRRIRIKKAFWIKRPVSVTTGKPTRVI